jgi:hypothetical protein
VNDCNESKPTYEAIVLVYLRSLISRPLEIIESPQLLYDAISM